MKVKVFIVHSCRTLCDPMDCSLPGSSVHPGKNIGVRQPFPSPGDLLDPRIKCGSPALQADFLPSEPPGKPKNMNGNINIKFKARSIRKEEEDGMTKGPMAENARCLGHSLSPLLANLILICHSHVFQYKQIIFHPLLQLSMDNTL